MGLRQLRRQNSPAAVHKARPGSGFPSRIPGWLWGWGPCAGLWQEGPLSTWLRRPLEGGAPEHVAAQPHVATHVAHLTDDGLLLLAQVLLAAVLELPVQVLVHLQDLREVPQPTCQPLTQGH